MLTTLLIFTLAITALLVSAKIFTNAAEKIGGHFGLPAFVIGVFIVGIGTSLPELISGVLSVKKGVSEILPGNIIGANISNLLLIIGLAVVLNRKSIILNSAYLYIDLHFLLGSFLYFYVIAYDGAIHFGEAFIGLVVFIVYAFYLIKEAPASEAQPGTTTSVFPLTSLGLLVVSCAGIYFGADFTIASLEKIAHFLNVPNSVIALTLLSLGTTLPELVVNIAAIRQSKAEMAIGNVLGSCVFNTLVISPVASCIGPINVPPALTAFSLPLMAACGLLFYLLAQDKKMSVWEGLLFVCLYILFIIKTAG